MRPGRWELHKEIETENGTDYFLDGRGETSLVEIPVAVVYGRKTRWLSSRPPLLYLALINLAHYQKYSDYLEGHRICIPQLCTDDTGLKIEVIGHHSIHKTQAGREIYFAEPMGAGLSPQRQDLLDLQEQMAILGLSVMASKKPQPEKTATEVSINHLESDSVLATAARSLIERLLWTALMLLELHQRKLSSVAG